MSTEKQNIEYKSIQKIRSGDRGFKDLSVTCVAFANAQGGTIYVGFENTTEAPLKTQHVTTEEVNDTLSRLRSLCYNTGLVGSEVITHPNGGEYFEVHVMAALKSIATTSDGKIYIRIGDKCEPVRNEDLQRLFVEKGMYQWELLTTNICVKDIPHENIALFASEIRASDRVKEHVKQMTDDEILDHYHMVEHDFMTNLGVLWLGSAKQRSRISYPITVQYIVYDRLEQKVRKIEWHDNTLNPKQLLLEVENEATELTYAYEFPDGLFRKQIRYYNKEVVRELLVNAFAHKSFTISSDIMLCVYPDRMEISNPGGLPLGVTKDNILHQKIRRNPYLINIMSDLKLMEGEGSGYNLIYELNAKEAKHPPVIESSFNETHIIQQSEITDVNLLPLWDYTLQNYTLSQKNFIAFGIIARSGKILSTKLSLELQLEDDERLRSYTTALLKDGIVCSRGSGKGTTFYINPRFVANAKVNIRTSLKTIEPYRLKALILEDLKYHPQSLISEIAKRLPDVEYKDLRKTLYSMVGESVKISGGKAYRRYESMSVSEMAENKSIKKQN